MDSIASQKTNLQSLLSEHNSIGVIASDRQNIDVLAAALSLHLIFQDSGKNSQVISKKEPIVEHSFLVGIDQLRKSFGGLTKTLTVSFPYRDGEIEKVSYNIEGDRLNVNLFASELGIKFEEKDVKYIRQGSSPQLIVTIGIHDQSEIDGLIDATSAKIINIDNDVNNSLFGQATFVDAYYSSLSEIVAKLAIDMGLQVEFDVAQNLLDGISFATNNFNSPKTSPLAFEMAGALMQKGAIRKPVKEVRSQSQDTSLSMLNVKQGGGQKQFGQQKQFQKGNLPPKFPKQNFPQQPQQQQPQRMNDVFEDSFQEVNEPFVQQMPQQPKPAPQEFNNPMTSMPQEDTMQDMTSNGTTIPTEDEAPSDWFVPKVFKSTKNQQ